MNDYRTLCPQACPVKSDGHTGVYKVPRVRDGALDLGVIKVVTAPTSGISGIRQNEMHVCISLAQIRISDRTPHW